MINNNWIHISISKHPWWYHYIFYILQLIQAVVGLLSFGFIYVNICLPYSRWYMKYCMNKQKRKRQND